MLCRLAVFPEILVSDKHILVFRLILFHEEILEIMRACRDVVYHKIKHKVIFFSECFNIIKCAESFINGVISHRSKSPVRRGREKGQYMNAAYCFFVMLVKYSVKLTDIFSQTVSIGYKHNFILYLHISDFLSYSVFPRRLAGEFIVMSYVYQPLTAPFATPPIICF